MCLLWDVPGRSRCPNERKGIPKMDEYEVEIGGIKHTMQLDKDDVERYGDRAKKAAKAPANKGGRAPANKAAETPPADAPDGSGA